MASLCGAGSVQRRNETPRLALSVGAVAALGQSQKSECASRKARGRGGSGKITELTPSNGWRGGLVCRVLSAESVLRRPICQTLFKRGVGAALVAAQRRSLQTPWRILSLRGTRTQYSNDNENEFHGDPIIPRLNERRAHG